MTNYNDLISISKMLDELQIPIDWKTGGVCVPGELGSEVRVDEDGTYSLLSFESDPILLLEPKHFMETLKLTEKEFRLELFATV